MTKHKILIKQIVDTGIRMEINYTFAECRVHIDTEEGPATIIFDIESACALSAALDEDPLEHITSPKPWWRRIFNA